MPKASLNKTITKMIKQSDKTAFFKIATRLLPKTLKALNFRPTQKQRKSFIKSSYKYNFKFYIYKYIFKK
ncbi:hypothetical protein BB397_01240 [Helicobacter pylori]|nr:hypothetical protein BB397_01240 [Helicobacter pylori]